MKILNLESGTPFQMGKGKNWRVVHPDMGARQITLNHGLHQPGQEFTQHIHDASEDMIIVLEGGGAMRQGSVYTPIAAGEGIFVPAGEAHGTVNTTDQPARLISFQAPPDMALYRGERDRPDHAPTPEPGRRSHVQVIPMHKAGPVFGKPGDWRSVISPEKGSQHLALDRIQLGVGEGFTHEGINSESIYVLIAGQATVRAEGQMRTLNARDVIFVQPGDAFSLSQTGEEPLTLVHCWAL
jgi:mannose-6-phosphate isomerase-like protein (cupin superfamily)